jgi:GNAT superfamily N-acetyltransferase
MQIVQLKELSVPDIAALMAEGQPWLPESSDHWFFKTFCGSTSFAVIIDGRPAGGLIACRNQDGADEIYIDQVAVHRLFRGRGVVDALFHAIEEKARAVGCSRLWLSTDPRNPAVRVWPRLGFVNCPGDFNDGALAVRRDFKGPGKHRALFEKRL